MKITVDEMGDLIEQSLTREPNVRLDFEKLTSLINARQRRHEVTKRISILVSPPGKRRIPRKRISLMSESTVVANTNLPAVPETASEGSPATSFPPGYVEFIKKLEEVVNQLRDDISDLDQRLDVLANRWNIAATDAVAIAEEARTKVLALEARALEFNQRSSHKL